MFLYRGLHPRLLYYALSGLLVFFFNNAKLSNIALRGLLYCNKILVPKRRAALVGGVTYEHSSSPKNRQLQLNYLRLEAEGFDFT